MRCGTAAYPTTGRLGDLDQPSAVIQYYVHGLPAWVTVPMALPAAQNVKLIATTTVFFVWPPTFLLIMESASVCADQNDSVT